MGKSPEDLCKQQNKVMFFSMKFTRSQLAKVLTIFFCFLSFSSILSFNYTKRWIITTQVCQSIFLLLFTCIFISWYLAINCHCRTMTRWTSCSSQSLIGSQSWSSSQSSALCKLLRFLWVFTITLFYVERQILRGFYYV